MNSWWYSRWCERWRTMLAAGAAAVGLAGDPSPHPTVSLWWSAFERRARVASLAIVAMLALLVPGCTSTGGVDGAQVVKITCGVIAGLDRLACPLAGAVLTVTNGVVTSATPISPNVDPLPSSGSP